MLAHKFGMVGKDDAGSVAKAINELSPPMVDASRHVKPVTLEEWLEQQKQKG